MTATREIRNFRKIGDATDIPNLIEIQVGSYKRFLQEEKSSKERSPTGLEGLLREVYPIQSYDENITLEYLDYSLGRARYTPDECRQLRLTYGMPLRIRLRLVRKDHDEIQEDLVYLGDMPIMIGGGEFIINGAERVIVSQLHRSPGVDFIKDQAEGDRALHACRIIPERGSWIEIEVTKKDILVVRIDQSSKLPATTFLEGYDFARAYGPINLELVLPVVDVVGESRTNADVFGELCARLGVLDGTEPSGEVDLLVRVLDSLPGTIGTLAAFA